ncbi:MAG TPA: hypothetical protein VFT45_18520 [Longimicrobium sp.]|nr:hypothetical protein [Longimicrobium sp.]
MAARRTVRALPRPMRVLLLLAALVLAGCGDTQPPPDTPRREYVRMPPPPLDSLRAAPETVSIGDLPVVAAADLWLNLMPGDQPEGEPAGPPMSPLLGSIDIHPADTASARTLPAGLSLQGGWLLAGDSIWALGVAPSDATNGISTSLALEVGGGPTWLGREESRVDVVVRVRRPDGTAVLLRVRAAHVQVAV